MLLLWCTMEYGINVCPKVLLYGAIFHQCDMCRNFTVIYGICLFRMGATETQVTRLAVGFLIGITIVAFIVLRLLAFINRKETRIRQMFRRKGNFHI